MQKSPVSESLVTVAVRPAAVDALPEVYTVRGRMEHTYLRKLDFAVEGSPTRQQLMSPRSLMPSLAELLCTPPKSMSRMPSFTSFPPTFIASPDLLSPVSLVLMKPKAIALQRMLY